VGAMRLQLEPVERVDVPDLVQTDNDIFNKVITVFSFLCDEVAELKHTAEDSFYGPLLIFGEPAHNDDRDFLDGEEELQMGRTLHFFQDLGNFVDRLNGVTVNIIHQLASLQQTGRKIYQSTFRNVELLPVYEALGTVLTILITLDALVLENEAIMNSWMAYKKMMQYVRADPGRYEVEEDHVKTFERLLVTLDQTVLAGAMFQGCIEQDFEQPPLDGEGSARVNVSDNKVFLTHLNKGIAQRLQHHSVSVGHKYETDNRKCLVGVFGMYVLYRRLVPQNIQPDKAFYLQMWKVQLKMPVVTLAGKVPWFPSDFLREHAPSNIDKMEPPDATVYRRNFLKHLKSVDKKGLSKFNQTTNVLLTEFSLWSVNVNNVARPVGELEDGVPLPQSLSKQAWVIVEGLLLAHRIKNHYEEFLTLHVALDLPLDRAYLDSLSRCAELLKAVEAVFETRVVIFAQTKAHMIRQLTGTLVKILTPMKQRLAVKRQMDATIVDILAAITIVEDVFKGSESLSYTRFVVVANAVRVILAKYSGLDSKTTQNVDNLLRQIELLSDFQSQMKKVCNTQTLYWNRELLGPFFKKVMANGGEQAGRLRYLVAAFSDPIPLLRVLLHEEPPEAGKNTSHLIAYQDYVEKMLREYVVLPLCKSIEDSLRLHVHAANWDHMEAPNPVDKGLRALSKHLQAKPLRLFSKAINIRAEVCAYLEKEFYELTVLALHDYKTYAEMRNLAKSNFGLDIGDSFLPMGTLDQGLDVLQIMRNIHIFVTRYNYNMNGQFFLEKKPTRGAKHLNAINTQSISNSIRTHGLGMLNTTVNFSYQFLQKKFQIFTQFLFDEYIKGYLARERRWYRKNKAANNYRYPYDRAMAFTKEIRELGVTDDGLSFLDQFRKLIAEIGNALGYVRMVRSAGMQFCSDAITFIPDVDNIVSFGQHAGNGDPGPNEDGNTEEPASSINGANLSEDAVDAGKNLDSVLSELLKNFTEGTNYFQMLVKVFQDVLLKDEHGYLKNFYMIVPALTINFIETLRISKDKMDKTLREGSRQVAYFSDDGFMVGLAYIMSVLQQNKEFDGLHWFDTVKVKFSEDHAKFQSEMTRAKKSSRRKDKEDESELFLKSARVERAHQDFELLRWTLSGARIFFKDR
jgi:WASH complex subunit 7